jgi:hypothetical protein
LREHGAPDRHWPVPSAGWQAANLGQSLRVGVNRYQSSVARTFEKHVACSQDPRS